MNQVVKVMNREDLCRSVREDLCYKLVHRLVGTGSVQLYILIDTVRAKYLTQISKL